MKKMMILAASLFLCSALYASENDATAKKADPKNADNALIENVFRKMEDAMAKEDVEAYLSVFSKRVEIVTPDGANLSYDDVKEYLVDLFESYDSIRDERTGPLDIRLKEKENTAEVISAYRMSGIPKGAKEPEIFDEGALKLTLNKLPSFSAKIPPAYQIIAVAYLAAENTASGLLEDRNLLLKTVKDNYGIDLMAEGGFERYRELILQELKAENDAAREELEARMAILKKRNQKTFSVSIKKEIQSDMIELEKSLGMLPNDSEITAIVDAEITDLKEIFLGK